MGFVSGTIAGRDMNSVVRILFHQLYTRKPLPEFREGILEVLRPTHALRTALHGINVEFGLIVLCLPLVDDDIRLRPANSGLVRVTSTLAGFVVPDDRNLDVDAVQPVRHFSIAI